MAGFVPGCRHRFGRFGHYSRDHHDLCCPLYTLQQDQLRMKEEDSKSPILRALFYLLVVVILVFNLFPFLYAIVSSFRPNADLFSTDLIPKSFTFGHYDEIFKDPRFVPVLSTSSTLL